MAECLPIKFYFEVVIYYCLAELNSRKVKICPMIDQWVDSLMIPRPTASA